MTAYSKQGNQDGLPGIVGTWTEPGIQCEECHGPGSLHVANPRGVALAIERDSELCGKCHIRGPIEVVEAKDGFIEHHEQYEELFQSKHITINCVTCHDPHQGVIQARQAGEKTVRVECQNCYYEKTQPAKVPHAAPGVRCIDCHMPRVAKTAWGDAAKFTGDIRTHLMAIDPNQIWQLTENGKAALSQISLDFACRHCHVEGGKADDGCGLEVGGQQDERACRLIRQEFVDPLHRHAALPQQRDPIHHVRRRALNPFRVIGCAWGRHNRPAEAARVQSGHAGGQ